MRVLFSPRDREEFQRRGISEAQVRQQLERFEIGFPSLRLQRPCTVGDGIRRISPEEHPRYQQIFEQARAAGRVTKFVPASGAASRMFKLPLKFYHHYEVIDVHAVTEKAEAGDEDHRDFLHFLTHLPRFAFYDDLALSLARLGRNLEVIRARGSDYREVLEALLFEKGLNYARLPKGLIKFHRYGDRSRTAFEEHLVEAEVYAKGASGTARVHFTVPAHHADRIRLHVEWFARHRSNARYEVTFSVQKPSTDTIAVDLNHQPFRNPDGSLLFRPGGHGALLDNLNDLQGDIVFIKNIDNVVPDWLKPDTYLYKQVLGGVLVSLQNEVFYFLRRLTEGPVDEAVLESAERFAERELSLQVPVEVRQGSVERRVEFLIRKLNRPLRVCGMVKNEGEPGGGPFWVAQEDGSLSLQIVESSQVDFDSEEQRNIWNSSTHFNPVDLVCGVRDFQGKPFDLKQFVDPNTGFIARKSKDGQELKALELPGLWNGSMAYWNTVFVEVPITTFNPVKTVLDLLRPQHQPKATSEMATSPA